MPFVQGGVWVNGQHPASKEALRRAIAAGKQVHFYPTVLTGHQYRGLVSKMSVVDTLTVVGPDPLRSRLFWCNINRTANGRIVVT